MFIFVSCLLYTSPYILLWRNELVAATEHEYISRRTIVLITIYVLEHIKSIVVFDKNVRTHADCVGTPKPNAVYTSLRMNRGGPPRKDKRKRLFCRGLEDEKRDTGCSKWAVVSGNGNISAE